MSKRLSKKERRNIMSKLDTDNKPNNFTDEMISNFVGGRQQARIIAINYIKNLTTKPVEVNSPYFLNLFEIRIYYTLEAKENLDLDFHFKDVCTMIANR